MCTVFIATHHQDFRLISLSNRDEFYQRQSEPLTKRGQTYCGLDSLQGGTWLGITTNGRYAVLTNYRDPNRHRTKAPSRGHLTLDFLQGNQSAKDYTLGLTSAGSSYNGFNLICYDSKQSYYVSNYQPNVQELTPDIWGLSNGLLSSRWPKVKSGCEKFRKLILNFNKQNIDWRMAMAMMADTSQYPDHLLPNTGVGLSLEKALSPLFIETKIYGTVSTTLIALDRDGKLNIWEKDHLNNNIISFQDQLI